MFCSIIELLLHMCFSFVFRKQEVLLAVAAMVWRPVERFAALQCHGILYSMAGLDHSAIEMAEAGVCTIALV